MKFFNPFLAFCILASVVACGGTDNKNEASSDPQETEKIKEKQPQNMKSVDLSEYGITATIMIPNESVGMAKVDANAMGGVNIEVGDQFGIEINPFGVGIDEFKSELETSQVYDIQIIDETEQHLVFQKTIADSGVEEEYHFFMNQTINGEVYEIKSMQDKAFSRNSVMKMLESAKRVIEKSMG